MDCCDHCHSPDPHRGNTAYRRVLWVVLCINATMFLIEIGAGVAAGSASLQADALDFFGDAANCAISLFVVGMALRYRTMAALAKGTSMGLFGLWIIETAAWHALHGTLPNAFAMGAVGLVALGANALSFGLLWAYRGGDANMRSAWIRTAQWTYSATWLSSGGGGSVRNRRRAAGYHCRSHHGAAWPCKEHGS